MDMDSFVLITLSITGAIVLGLLLVAVLWKGKDPVAEHKKILKSFVEDVKKEIDEVLVKYPNLKANTVIEGNNSHKLVDQGKIYGKNILLLFPILSPAKQGAYHDNGHSFFEALDYVSLVVSGTVSDYKITGSAVLKYPEVIVTVEYFSKKNIFVENCQQS